MEKIPTNQNDVLRNQIAECYVEDFDPENPIYSRREEEVSTINPEEGSQTYIRITRFPYFQCSRCQRFFPSKKIGIVQIQVSGNKEKAKSDNPGRIIKYRFCRRCSNLLRIKGFIALLFAPFRDLREGGD